MRGHDKITTKKTVPYGPALRLQIKELNLFCCTMLTVAGLACLDH